MKAVSKRPVTQKVVKQIGKKALLKTGGKALGKGLGKMALKQVPGVGAVVAGVEAGARLATGDFVGAALSAAEAIPGLGLAAGAANVARDVRRATKIAKKARTLTKVSKGAGKTAKTISGANVIKRFKRSKAAKVPKAIRNKKVLGGIAGGVSVPTAVGVGKRLLGGAAAAGGDALGHVGRRSAGK